MKKYLLGLFAVVLAIGFSAFTAKEKNNRIFYYQGPNLSEAQVETESNWTTSAITCLAGSTKACQFEIPDSYVTGSGSTLSSLAPNVSVLAPAGTSVPVDDVRHSVDGSIYVDITNKD